MQREKFYQLQRIFMRGLDKNERIRLLIKKAHLIFAMSKSVRWEFSASIK